MSLLDGVGCHWCLLVCYQWGVSSNNGKNHCWLVTRESLGNGTPPGISWVFSLRMRPETLQWHRRKADHSQAQMIWVQYGNGQIHWYPHLLAIFNVYITGWLPRSDEEDTFMLMTNSFYSPGVRPSVTIGTKKNIEAHCTRQKDNKSSPWLGNSPGKWDKNMKGLFLLIFLRSMDYGFYNCFYGSAMRLCLLIPTVIKQTLFCCGGMNAKRIPPPRSGPHF